VIGAIVGDVIGSHYENDRQKTRKFEFHSPYARFTDDSVMTIAVARAIETGCGYGEAMRAVGTQYPSCGYGGRFAEWLFDPSLEKYDSNGNGSAMRVSAVAWAFETEEEVLREAEAQAAVTHGSDEGIRGAKAAALAVFLARRGCGRREIAARVASVSGYDLGRSLDSIRPTYEAHIACDLSVPEAIIAFLESRSFDGALRNAISLGGDADTQAAIAGSIAEAFYGGVPAKTAEFALSRLSPWLLEQAEPFVRRYCLPSSAAALRSRLDSAMGLLRDHGSLSASRVPELSDAAELLLEGPSLAGVDTKPAFIALISGGWSRLILDASRLERLGEAELADLEFYANSVRSRLGGIAILGLAPALVPGIEAAATRSKILLAASRPEALSYLELSRGRGPHRS